MRVILLILIAVNLLFGAYTASEIGGDKVVYDDATGLTWQNEPYTQVEEGAFQTQTNDGKVGTWEYAIDYCKRLDYAGKTDWRLPNVNELYMIADRSKVSPAMDAVFNPSVDVSSGFYWSSTTVASGSSDAWLVNFYGGHDYWVGKTGSSYVRCVRSGQIAPLNASPVPLSPFAKALTALLLALGVAMFARRRSAA